MKADQKDKKDFPISPLAIKAMHAVNRPEVVQKLYSRDKQQLIKDFIVEMDAKNEAYYFIIENGHFDAFCSYCKNPANEVCSVIPKEQISKATKNLFGKFSLTDEEVSSLTPSQILERAAERRELEILIHTNNYFKENSIHDGIKALQEVYIGWVHSKSFKENIYSEDVSNEILEIQKLLVGLAGADTWALPDATQELSRKFTIEN
ncbi:MAG: hypothetical protein M1292_06755 [Bacteroidetes bacterium]|nr:hypothetical protein [Bacteroidota bacterium]